MNVKQKVEKLEKDAQGKGSPWTEISDDGRTLTRYDGETVVYKVRLTGNLTWRDL